MDITEKIKERERLVEEASIIKNALDAVNRDLKTLKEQFKPQPVFRVVEVLKGQATRDSHISLFTDTIRIKLECVNQEEINIFHKLWDEEPVTTEERLSLIYFWHDGFIYSDSGGGWVVLDIDRFSNRKNTDKLECSADEWTSILAGQIPDHMWSSYIKHA